MPGEEQKGIRFHHSLCRFPLIRQELLEVIPDFSKFNLGILALKSRVFSANELGIRFVVNDGRIVSPVDDCRCYSHGTLKLAENT